MGDDTFRADWETVVNDMATASPGETCKAEYPASGRDTLKGLPLVSLSGSTGADSDPQQTRFKSSQIEILHELARGGMGIVYRGEQNSLKREIAIKQLLPEIQEDHYKDRFVNEALVTAYLDHPNIVSVHELGMSGEGEPLLCMKLVQGQSWKEILDQRPLKQSRTRRELDLEVQLRRLIPVCHAIEFAHMKGILHLDLKPENIMVGEFGEVVVMDWGIAVEYNLALDNQQRTVRHETVNKPMGTPGYMAPELALGDGSALSPRTDVYLLGAVLYEILMRKSPHASGSFWMTVLSARESKPPEFNSHVPRELKRICTRAMSKDPEDRHESVKAFENDLKLYLSNRENKKGLFVCTVFTMALAVLGLLSWLLLSNQTELNDSQSLRYESFRVANGLRDSSEDLTAMARAYVTTGDDRYEKAYWDILAIRNGQIPGPDGSQVPLRDLIASLGLSDRELDKLRQAEANSNELVASEKQAFNAVKGIFQDGNGEYTVQGEPDFEQARSLVFGDRYDEQKAIIMNPIDDFMRLLDNRTRQTVTDDLVKSSRTLWLVMAVVFLLIVISIAYYITLSGRIRDRYTA